MGRNSRASGLFETWNPARADYDVMGNEKPHSINMEYLAYDTI
jgi:hypothetical protein